MARIHDVVIDSSHPASIARLRGEGIFDPEDDPSVLVEAPGTLPRLFFRLVSVPKAVKNRVHLDLRCDRVAGELERLIGLGASIVAEYDDHVVLRDPEGNEFCLSQPA
jgi:Glyoxalase-like domain